MASQRGRNSGVTGLVDLAGAPAFTVNVYAFRQKFKTETAPRRGRGDGAWDGPNSRAFLPGSTLALSGTVANAGYPLPAQWKGQEGSLALQFHQVDASASAAKQDLSVRVTHAEISMKADGEGWDIALTCLVLANPTFTGFGGTAASATTPTQSDKELWSGTKTADPQNLLTSQVREIEVWPLGDSDHAERLKLVSVIAAATANAFTGAKVKLARLEPNRSDDAGVITVQLSLTDSAEDVVNPITQTTYDANGLTSSATSAAINGAPANPGGDFVERDGTVREIHDAAILSTKNYGLRDTVEDVTMPGSQRSDDPSKLGRWEHYTAVTETGTAPTTPTPSLSGLVLRGVAREQLNRKKWRHQFVFGETTAEEDVEFPGSPRGVDPQTLADQEQKTDVTDLSTPPTTPTPNNSALVLRRTESVRMTDGGKWRHTWTFARTTTKDDVENEGTEDTIDEADVFPTGTVTIVDASANPPVLTPVAPLKIRTVTTRKLHATRWRHTFELKTTTTLDELIFPNSPVDDDPQNLDDDTAITQVQGSGAVSPPSAPSGLKLRKSHIVQLNDSWWQATYRFARTDTKDDIEMPETQRTLDPLAIDSQAVTTEVYDTASPPADPAAPSGELQIAGRRYVTLNGLRSKRATVFDVTTSAQKREYPQTKTTTDANAQDLRSSKMQATVYSGSPPADPAAPTGQKLLEKFDVPITPAKNMRVWIFGKKDSVDEVEFGFEKVTIDPQSIESAEVQATVYNGSAPADPAAPAGLQLRLKYDHPLTPVIGGFGARFVRVWLFAVDTTADEVLNPLNVTAVDPQGLESTQQKASFATPALDGTYTLRETITRTHVTGKTLTIARGGLRSTKDDVEMPGTSARYSPTAQGVDEQTTVVADTGTTVSELARAYGASRKDDPTFLWVEVIRLNVNQVAQRVKQAANFELIDAISFGGKRPVLAIGGAGVLVYLARKLKMGTKGGTTLWKFKIAPVSRSVSYVEFTLRRRVVEKAGQPLPFMDIALPGRSNGNTFLGLPAFTVEFLGANPMTNLKIKAPRVVDLELKFRFSSIGVFDETGIEPGWHTTDADLDGVDEKRFVQASLFGWTASPALPLDFDGFLPVP